MMRARNFPYAVLTTLFLGSAVVACETESVEQEQVDDPQERQLRKNAGIHDEDAPASAEDMREAADLKEDDDPPPQTAQEMREEVGLHPEEPPEQPR